MILIVIAAFAFLSVSFLLAGNNTSGAAMAIPPDHYVQVYGKIDEGQALLKEGDLVLRMNQDPTSQAIKNFNRQDKSYSHAGLVLIENGFPYIYHIVNGDENPDERLRKDSLIRFSYPRKNYGFGIYRYNINASEIKKLKQKIQEWYTMGLRFDSSFNLETDERMYCSEMIKKALSFSTKNRIIIETTPLTDMEAKILASHIQRPPTAAKKLGIVAIDNLYMNKNCKPVRKYSFHE